MRVGSRESGVAGNTIPETVLKFFPYSPFPIPYSQLLCIFNAQQLTRFGITSAIYKMQEAFILWVIYRTSYYKLQVIHGDNRNLRDYVTDFVLWLWLWRRGTIRD
jgi:hypothetical protein